MAEQSHPGMFHFDEQQLLPAEEKLEVKKKEQKVRIGIPANIDLNEQCLPLTPQAVEMLISLGHEVIIESGAGSKIRYTDLEYSNSGALVTQSKAEVFQSDYLLKVAPFTTDEITLMRGNQVLFSMLQIDTQCETTVRMLMQKKITAIAFEYIKDDTGALPVMQSLSEISGIVAMTVAGELLSNSNGGKGVLFGGVTGISPAAVIILGADTAAEFAARAAIGLGAEVKVFDNSVGKLRSFERKFNQKIFTSLYYPRVLKKAIQSADVALGAQPFNGVPQYVVPKEMIQKMKKGSIIIDLNASQGGCFETTTCTTLSNPTYEREGVIHYCVPNITSRVSRTTTIALSNIFASILMEIGEIGGISHYIKSQKGFREGVITYNGILTNKDVGKKFNIPSKDLDLLMAAF
ncbi:MAG TPA: alanine dehydrogenase [Prolixibacteraceae bacterium]|nr:alanine dehydrogenase [Prolixibacteraceae bacterium]HPS14068.1 alanine dehydrogenase [Prolixibacteraceae bacterium]